MDWGNVIVGFLLAVAGGVLAAMIGGWGFYTGGIAHAAGALLALRGWTGPGLDAAPAGWLVLYRVQVLTAAVATPFLVRYLIRGDPFRPTARGGGLGFSPIRFAWGRSKLGAAGARRRRDYAAYARAPQGVTP